MAAKSYGNTKWKVQIVSNAGGPRMHKGVAGKAILGASEFRCANTKQGVVFARSLEGCVVG
jgi:hypothetical protein